jgi:hypothetical protein
MNPVPDPGGPKTYGSCGYGSATLVERMGGKITYFTATMKGREIEIFTPGNDSEPNHKMARLPDADSLKDNTHSKSTKTSPKKCLPE